MIPFAEKTLSLPLVAKLLLAVNLGALLFALLMQFGLDLQPCVLCLWQRVPFSAAAFLTLLIWAWKPYRHQTVILLILCALTYLFGLGLAVFHSGVELHWWMGTSGCAVEPLQGATATDLREALLQKVAPRCDEITWSIFGLSMANLNIALSLALAFASAAAAAKLAQDQ